MMSTVNFNSFIDRNSFEKYSIAHRSLLSHLCDVSSSSSLPTSSSSEKPNGPPLRSNRINVKPNQQQQLENKRRSSLTSSEQSLYLKLHRKCFKSRDGGSLTTEEEEERRLYAQLHQKVQKEQKLFLRIAEENESKKTTIYTVGEEVHRFVTEYDRYGYETALKYPRFYAIKDQVPLVTMASSLRTGVMNIHLIQTVLEMGKVSRLVFPKMNQSKQTLNQNYDKIYSRYPICKENNELQNVLFKTPVSKDLNAEKLAFKYGSQIVVSSSGLKTLFANGQSCLENDWEIPVVVKQFDDDLARRVVFIDKPFRNRSSSIFDYNLKYQKRALKTLITHPKHLKSYSFDSYKKEASIGSKLQVADDRKGNELEVEKNEIDSDLSPKAVELDSNESELLDTNRERHEVNSYGQETTFDAESDDGKLVIDDGDVEEVNKMDEDLQNISTKLPNEAKSMATSSPQSPPHVRRSLRIQNKTNELASSSATTVVAEQKVVFGCEGRNKRKLHEVDVSSLKNISKKRLIPVKCDPQQAISTLDEIEELQAEMFRDIHKTSQNQQVSGVEPNAFQSGKENSDDYVPPTTDTNVTYGLWKIGKINLLIRSSVDGCSGTKNEVSTVHVQPMLEYWSVIGGHLLSFTECARQWIGTKIRPNSTLTRVRINAFNYEVIGVEELDMNQTNKITNGFLPKDNLDVLHTILQRLLLLPKGNYLLKHESGEGTCNILKEVDKDVSCDSSKYVFDLHEDCKAVMTNGHSMSERIPWTPIDANALLFKHIKFNRIPATFEPKSASNMSLKSRRKKKKNKGKK